MTSKFCRSWMFAFAIFAVSTQARAITNYTPEDLTALSNDSVGALIKTVGIGGDFRAYMPVTPLGVLLGFDVGLDITYISLPSEFSTALRAASGAADVPSGVPLPKLNIHKGLPWNLDIGFSFMNLSDGSQTAYKSYGGSLQWAFISGAALPSIAVRASATYNTLYFIKSTTYTVDVVASKNLFIIDPYVGVGVQIASGELEIPAGTPGADSLELSQSTTAPHFYGGAMLKLAILRIAAQADYNTAGILTFGGKISLGF